MILFLFTFFVFLLFDLFIFIVFSFFDRILDRIISYFFPTKLELKKDRKEYSGYNIS